MRGTAPFHQRQLATWSSHVPRHTGGGTAHRSNTRDADRSTLASIDSTYGSRPQRPFQRRPAVSAAPPASWRCTSPGWPSARRRTDRNSHSSTTAPDSRRRTSSVRRNRGPCVVVLSVNVAQHGHALRRCHTLPASQAYAILSTTRTAHPLYSTPTVVLPPSGNDLTVGNPCTSCCEHSPFSTVCMQQSLCHASVPRSTRPMLSKRSLCYKRLHSQHRR
jgi:hypothetical protein